MKEKQFQLEEAYILETRNVTSGGGDSGTTTSHYAKLELMNAGRKEFPISSSLRGKITEDDMGIAVLSLDGKELWHFENLRN